MGLFSMLFRSRKKRRRELSIRRQERGWEANGKKRETLRKKSTTPISDEGSRSESPVAERPRDSVPPKTPVKVAELDVKAPIPRPTPAQTDRQMKRHQSLQAGPKVQAALKLPQVFVDPPPECAELSGESVPHPARSNVPTELAEGEAVDGRRSSQDAAGSRFKAYRRGTTDENCPSCLVPGFRWVGSADKQPKTPMRSSTWPYEGLSKAGVMESIGPSIGFRSADGEDRAANERIKNGEENGKEDGKKECDEQELAAATAESPSTVASDATPTMSPISPLSPLSSQTSLSSEDEDIVLPLNSRPVRKMGSVVKMSSPEDSPSPSVDSGLYTKGSTVSLKQLRARHSLLESRRQTLLQLHKIEQEQEEILEMLASIPDGED